MENVSGKVKRLREQMGWTEKDLARRINSMELNVKNVERSGTTTLSVIARICDAFGISLHDFFYNCEVDDKTMPKRKRYTGVPHESK